MDSNPQDQPSIENLYQPLDIWKAYIRILRKFDGEYPLEYAKVPEILKHYSPYDIRNLTEDDVQALKNLNAIPNENPMIPEAREVYQARNYIHALKKLSGTAEFAKVPVPLRLYCNDDEALNNLDPEHMEALRMMNVLPDSLFQNHTSVQDTDAQKLDQALTEYCNQDPELRRLIHDPRLYQDPEKMREFAAHPKIQMFFAMHPDLKQISDKQSEKFRTQYLQAMGWPAPATTSTEPTGPYRSHPYGTPDPSQAQNPFGTGIPFPNTFNAKLDRDLAKTVAQMSEMYSEGSAAIMNSIFESNKKISEAFRKAGG